MGREEEEESGKENANCKNERNQKKSRPSLEELAQGMHGKIVLERGVKNILVLRLEPYVVGSRARGHWVTDCW